MLPSEKEEVRATGLKSSIRSLKATFGSPAPSLGSVRVLMSSGLHRTSAGDMSAKVFRTHVHDIRAYLTIRLRDVERSRLVCKAAWEELEHARVSDLKRAPSRQAHLYLLARSLSEFDRLFDDAFEERSVDAVPWAAAPPGSPKGYGEALDHLRHSLSDEEMELLELHHVRGLTEAGVGHVVGMREQDAKRKLQAATAWAAMLVTDVMDGRSPIEEVLGHAFRVLPPPSEEEDPIAESVPVPLPPGTSIRDRYTIEGKVGGGAFGWVYRANDVHVPGHVVALKLLHRPAHSEAAREGSIRELSLIASAFHPSLVHFKDHGWFQDRLWFVMPWYDGETLQDRIDRQALSADEAWTFFEPIARALASLHAAGIRHQDIKPDNIFLANIRTGLPAGPPTCFRYC